MAMKGKYGNRALRRQLNGARFGRACILISIMLMVFSKLWDLWSLGELTEKRRERNRGRNKQQMRSRTVFGNNQADDAEQNILQAKWHLVGLSISPGALAPSGSTKSDDISSYGRGGVRAIFCEIDWNLQKENPSTVPMFKDLETQSSNCYSTKVQRDLKDIVTKAREFDKTTSRGDVVAILPPTAFVFHETRCGSTLVANLLAAFDPKSNRVYSESPPPVTALKACEGMSESDCDPSKAAEVLRDVIYLMGRTNNMMEQRVFYKIQSVGVRSISVFTRAFPNTPWLFVYRDPVEVMMSHYKNGLPRHAVCMRAKTNPPPILKQVVQQQGRTMDSLTNEEFCVAHLASLCESAIQEHESTQTGQFINYDQLPDILWESVLPDYMKISVGDDEMERMQKVAQVYSKGRDHKANQKWVEDSATKHAKSPPKVREACNTFLQSYYDTLEELSTPTDEETSSQ